LPFALMNCGAIGGTLGILGAPDLQQTKNIWAIRKISKTVV